MARRLIGREAARLLIGTILILAAIVVFGHDDILDAKFYYSGEFAQLYFSLLSPDQTRAYIRTGILDLVFMHFYSSLIWYEFSRLASDPRYRKAALALPIIDLFETVSILLILVTGAIPQNLDWLGFLTAAKWTTAAAVFAWWLGLFINSRRHAYRGL